MARTKRYLNQSEFARLVGNGRSAISAAIKKGQVFKEGAGINPNHPINKAYAERAKKNSGNKAEVKAGKEAAKLLSGAGDIETLIETLRGISAESKKQKAEEEETKAEAEGNVKEVLARANTQKYAGEEKRAKAMKTNIELAEKLKELVRREHVVVWWKRVSSSMQNNLLTLDERISDEICAICGVTDPDIVSQVRKRIGDEVVTSMTMIKNEADKFPKIIGLVT